MQEKNKLENMAEKYKEEMMRLYSKKRSVAPSEPVAAVSEPVTEQKAIKKAEADIAHNMEQLSNPPMPEIPQDYGTGAAEVNKELTRSSKFPTAEEIMRAEARTVAVISTASRFEADDDLPHNQGNYNYEASDELEDYEDDEAPESNYPDEETDFEDLFDDDGIEANPADMKGTGYLQVEVTTGDGAMPVQQAVVIVTQEINGQQFLVTMKQTDRSGATELIPLPAPSASFSEAPDPSEKPFSEYTVTVYKKNFYTVPEVTVPIFDTVKSIQPVALIPLAEYDLQGTKKPNGGAQNA